MAAASSGPDSLRKGPLNAHSPNRSRIALQYLDDRKNLTVTLTRGRDDIVNGLLSATSPLGSELIGRSEDDEIEYTVDGRTRQVLIIKVEQVVSPSETPVAP